MSSLSSFLTRFDELDDTSCESEVESLFRELDELCVTKVELEVGGGVVVAKELIEGEGSSVDKVDEEMGVLQEIYLFKLKFYLMMYLNAMVNISIAKLL